MAVKYYRATAANFLSDNDVWYRTVGPGQHSGECQLPLCNHFEDLKHAVWREVTNTELSPEEVAMLILQGVICGG